MVKLREAESSELERLLQEHLEELGVPEVRQVLRNPFVTTRVAEILLAEPGSSATTRSGVIWPATPRHRRSMPCAWSRPSIGEIW